MNAELQPLVERIESLERQGRSWRTLALLALALAAVAFAMTLRAGSAAPPQRGRFSVVEANRILLRDADGSTAAGLESLPNGTLRLVLGNRSTGSAHLIVGRDGHAEFSLRSLEGRVQAGIVASTRPTMWISPDGRAPTVAMVTDATGGGGLVVKDAVGRDRFHAP